MAASLWHVMPDEVPDDEEVVWVRRWYGGAPWLATWYVGTSTFVHASGLVIPWYDVVKWKHQVEP